MCSLQPLFPRVELGILPVAETRSWHRSSAALPGAGRGGGREVEGREEGVRTGLLEFSKAQRTCGAPGTLHLTCTLWRPQNHFRLLHSPRSRAQNARERRALIKSRPDGALKLSGTASSSCRTDPLALPPSCPSSTRDAPLLRLYRTLRALSAKIWTPSHRSAPWSQPQQVGSPAAHSGVCCASFRE